MSNFEATLVQADSSHKDDSGTKSSNLEQPSIVSNLANWSHFGSYWNGYNSLKHLVVFGASYCEIGYSPRSPHPTAENPMGVTFPGYTYAEPGEPNWVGYLVRDYPPRRPETSVEARDSGAALLVYDYGVGGQTVDGVEWQVAKYFMPHVGTKPEWAPWSSDDTLFSTWVGINDTAMECDEKASVRKLYSVQDTLYNAGARNFLLIGVPPMHLSPARTGGEKPEGVPKTSGYNSPAPYKEWNNQLRSQAQSFVEHHPDSTLFIFSSYDLFTKIIDDLPRFGFDKESAWKNGGSIWVDQVHPTTKVHRVIAENLVHFLRLQKREPTHS